MFDNPHGFLDHRLNEPKSSPASSTGSRDSQHLGGERCSSDREIFGDVMPARRVCSSQEIFGSSSQHDLSSPDLFGVKSKQQRSGSQQLGDRGQASQQLGDKRRHDQQIFSQDLFGVKEAKQRRSSQKLGDGGQASQQLGDKRSRHDDQQMMGDGGQASQQLAGDKRSRHDDQQMGDGGRQAISDGRHDNDDDHQQSRDETASPDLFGVEDHSSAPPPWLEFDSQAILGEAEEKQIEDERQAHLELAAKEAAKEAAKKQADASRDHRSSSDESVEGQGDSKKRRK